MSVVTVRLLNKTTQTTQGLSLVEILFVKKNPLQDLLSSLNAVISTNERH